MLRDCLIVACGSFFGGGMRYAVTKIVQSGVIGSFPWGTMTVNVLGCLIIGFFSGLNYPGGVLGPSTKLLLTTGFCGGFTTFSTFMNENKALLTDSNYLYSMLYTLASLLLGFVFVVIGNQLTKLF